MKILLSLGLLFSIITLQDVKADLPSELDRQYSHGCGVPGLQGPRGSPGATGATGATGQTGALGSVGFVQAPGATGATGTVGTTGGAGAQGLTGSTGTTGTTGATGTVVDAHATFTGGAQATMTSLTPIIFSTAPITPQGISASLPTMSITLVQIGTYLVEWNLQINNTGTSTSVTTVLNLGGSSVANTSVPSVGIILSVSATTLLLSGQSLIETTSANEVLELQTQSTTGVPTVQGAWISITQVAPI